MSRITHFEIHASDPEKTIHFYEQVFGWQFTKWDGPMDYWMIVTGPDSEPGINGGLTRRMGPDPMAGQPVNSHVGTVRTESIDAAVTKVQQSGGVIEVPKMAIPGVGWLAYAKDPAGNIFGIYQHDEQAK